MLGTLYRPLEEVLGYYDYGDSYTVFAGTSYGHQVYTAIHESTHAILGWSSSSGVFQKLLAYLAERGPPTLSSIAKELLSISINDVRELHEATATYAEFIAARADGYIGLPDMEKHLPEEYRNWRGLYDNAFHECVPLRARGLLATHISRCALDTEILRDYSDLSPKKIRDFSTYLKLPNKSPGTRFIFLLDHIKTHDQQYLFRFFLEEYGRVENALIEAHASRSFENRKKSFEIQGSLRHAFEIDACAIPIASDTITISHNLTRFGNELVNGWKAYAKRVLGESFDFSFINTDLDEVDPLLEKQRFIFDLYPQTELFALSNVFDLKNPECYIASIIEWRNPKPFLLSEEPRRFLKQGDCYVRMLPVFENLPRFFVLSHGRSVISEVLETKFNGIVFRGSNYQYFGPDYRNVSRDAVVIVYWPSWSEFVERIGLQDEIKLATSEINAGGFAFLIRPASGVYHLIFGIGSSASMIFEEINRSSKRVLKLKLNQLATRAIQTVFNNAAYILGA